MQISDMIGQYNRNISQDVSVAAPTPSSQQLIDAVHKMAAGSIFEGTVNEMKGKDVVIGLGNGQTLMARIAGNVSLARGQSMFFQVKSNNGNQIEIRPYLKGNLSNPILIKALDTAGIASNERTVTMVKAMMQEQMSIDKQSLLDMVRTVVSHPGIDVETLVQMRKFGLPVTEEMANQFENYKMDRAAITEQMETFFDGLPEAFSGDGLNAVDAWNRNEQILNILLGERKEDSVVHGGEENPTSAQQTANSQQAAEQTPAGEKSAAMENARLANQAGHEAEFPQETSAKEAGTAKNGEWQNVLSQQDYPPGSAGRLLTDEQARELGAKLREFPELSGREPLYADGKMNLNLSPKDLLLALQQIMRQSDFEKTDSLKDLLSGKPYQKLLRNVLEQEWLVRPEDLKTTDKIRDLYERLERQMTQLERVFEQAGMDKSHLSQATLNVRENVEFMNELNQAYTYVQIPLKLSGQNAHSDLYVYSNKKNLADQDGDLTAFLHLDLDHLGSTDVSIAMKGRKVHTDFFLENDDSYNLIMEHMDMLQERLNHKGYQCTIQVQNKKKKIDFVEDFLKRDQPSTGRLHRYSFDVRA